MFNGLRNLAPGTYAGYGVLVFFIIIAGISMSEGNIIFGLLHTAILISATTAFCIMVVKNFSGYKPLAPIVLAYAAHFAIMVIRKGKFYFDWNLVELFFLYFMVVIVGGLSLPYVISRFRSAGIRSRGIPAMAVVEQASDDGGRVTESRVYRFYRMELTLRIEGHPKSPYRITDIFWVSDFYIHLFSSENPVIPIFVDRKDFKKVVLDLEAGAKA